MNICEEDIEFFFLHLNLITLNKEISNIVMGPIKLSFFFTVYKKYTSETGAYFKGSFDFKYENQQI